MKQETVRQHTGIEQKDLEKNIQKLLDDGISWYNIKIIQQDISKYFTLFWITTEGNE